MDCGVNNLIKLELRGARSEKIARRDYAGFGRDVLERDAEAGLEGVAPLLLRRQRCAAYFDAALDRFDVVLAEHDMTVIFGEDAEACGRNASRRWRRDRASRREEDAGALRFAWKMFFSGSLSSTFARPSTNSGASYGRSSSKFRA